MVTAESKTDNVIAAKKAGVDNYIVKPFNAQTLQHKIHAVFPDHAGARRSRRSVRRHHTSCRITSFRRDLRILEHRGERRGVRIVAPAELLGMDAGGDEQAIDAECGRALEVGAHRIADRQHARVRECRGRARLRAAAIACS